MKNYVESKMRKETKIEKKSITTLNEREYFIAEENHQQIKSHSESNILNRIIKKGEKDKQKFTTERKIQRDLHPVQRPGDELVKKPKIENPTIRYITNLINYSNYEGKMTHFIISRRKL